jgi:threonine dehydrogenase-like Zn-dependent dehydrogenase
MKAFTITEPGKTALVDIDEPVPGRSQVLIRIGTVGFCGSDLNTFRGLNPLISYPLIPGHEIGGVIEAVGLGVDAAWAVEQPVLVSPYTNCGDCTACRQGRPNCCRGNQTLGVQRNGAMTAYLVAPQEKLFTSSVLSLREMALVEPLTVGFHAVARGGVTAGETVLVFGCGAIGIGAIAGAAERQARVIAVDIDDEKLDLARACGATLTIDSARESLADTVHEQTGGHGPDVVIEAVGLPDTFVAAVELACFAGRVVYIGYAKQAVAYETKHFILKELDIRGSRNALPENFTEVIAYLERGVFPVGRMISQTVGLDEAGAALAAWDEDPSRITRIHVAM